MYLNKRRSILILLVYLQTYMIWSESTVCTANCVELKFQAVHCADCIIAYQSGSQFTTRIFYAHHSTELHFKQQFNFW